MPKLIFTDPTLKNKSYELLIEKTTVGRGEQNTLVIYDASLSNAHCEILLYGDEVIVRDLGSRNGTFVAGERLQNHQAQLKHGQTVRFGAVEARLELDGEDTDTTATDVTAVHAFGKAMRDQRRAELHPKPTDPSMHIGSQHPHPEEKTSSMPTSAPLPNPKPAKLPSEPVRPPSRANGWIVGAVIVLTLAAVVIWLLNRAR
jgi:pSer/pThr/pTyr-binding forkhead associated (FHA) protein